MVFSGRGLEAREVARLLKSAATMAYSGGTAEECMMGALNLVCAFTGWPLGHIYLADRKAMDLVPTNIWHNDDPERFSLFVEVTRRTRLPMGVGLPGRILETGRPAWIMDVQSDPDFQRVQAASRCGICGGFGFPLVSPLGIEGIAEFFTPEPVEPDESLLDLLSHIGLEIGHAIERGRARAVLAASEARLAEAERLGRLGAWLYHVDEERLAEAQRIAHLGFWSWEVASSSVIWSDELVRIYGLEPGSAPATFEDYLDRVHSDDRDRVRSAVMRTAATREPFEHDHRIVRPTGEERWVHARGEVVEQDANAARRLAGYCQDITERRSAAEERDRLRRQLSQSQRVETLGQLAGGVAHDFNNLLAAIQSYAAFVDEDLAALGDPRVEPMRADVAQIRRAAFRAAELIRQLLAFGRREVVRPRVLGLAAVVQDVEQLIRWTIGGRISLQISHGPDLWNVTADPGQFEQVLINLAVNARDAMPTGGTLSIETANLELDPRTAPDWPGIRPGRYVSLRVSDTGLGMSSEIAEQAFEPFFTTKPTGEGSGLGLATVRGIVTQAGGRVRIDTELGAGTTITLILPASDGDPPELDPPPVGRAHRSRGGETVLLVENEDAVRETAGRMLARHGYQVFLAASGAEAIDVARRHGSAIQLLVADAVMPHMLGKEAAARIAELVPGIRVLFISGHTQPVLASQGTLDPGVALVQKPFSEQELLSAVHAVLSRPADAGPTGPAPPTK